MKNDKHIALSPRNKTMSKLAKKSYLTSTGNMKFIFVIDQLQHGGIASTYVRWSQELITRGHSVAFFCQKQAGIFLSEIPPEAEVYICNATYAATASLSLYTYLRKQPQGSIIIAGGFTLIYAQILCPNKLKLWAYIPNSPGLSNSFQTYQSTLAETLRYRLMRWAITKAHVCSAVSDGTARDTEAWANLPNGSVHTVYNPAFTTRFEKASKLPKPHKWMKDRNLKVFCSFGRLVATKNYLHLLEAFKKVYEKNPSARLVIGGEGHLRPSLESYIHTHFSTPSPVQLLGNVPNPEAYMAHSIAYVSSSQLEAFGNVLVEALATGTQVIATNAPFGPSEIINSHKIGTLVPLNDKNALAQAMSKALKTKPITHKAQRVARAKDFSAQALWPQFSKVIQQLTNPSPLRVTIIQRVVAGYRAPLFEALAQKYNWRVVAASNFPNPQSLNAIIQAPWLNTFIYYFFGSPYRCHVPLFKIIRTHKPQVILLEAGTHMTSTWLSLLCWPLLRKLRFNLPKLVLWGHGAPVSFSTSTWRKAIFTGLRRWMLNCADGYLTYTAPEAAYLQKLAPRAHIGYVTNTINIAPILKLRKPLWKKEKSPHILMVGRITPDKRFADAIQSMPTIWKKIPNCQLTIIGGGDDLTHLKKLAGDELNKRIHLPGPIHNEEELASYYNRSHLFWLLGAAGLGVNHALAYGLPVLAYAPNLPGGPLHHPEIYYIEHNVNGWLVSSPTLKDMTDKLISLLQNPTSPRKALGATLPTYAETHLSLNQAIDSIYAFVSSVANQKSPRKA